MQTYNFKKTKKVVGVILLLLMLIPVEASLVVLVYPAQHTITITKKCHYYPAEKSNGYFVRDASTVCGPSINFIAFDNR